MSKEKKRVRKQINTCASINYIAIPNINLKSIQPQKNNLQHNVKLYSMTKPMQETKIKQTRKEHTKKSCFLCYIGVF